MNWDHVEQRMKSGPASAFWFLFWALLGISVVVGITWYVFSWFGEGARVVQQQFGPSALLTKYEWFKDTAAVLDKKRADIAVYEGRAKATRETYGEPLKWPRDVREQQSVWASEVAGIKASYNGLAAEYNSGMAKFNWAFANAGELPQGATVPLPREFKPYIAE